MKLSDLDYSYPEELIATSPSRPSRVMWVEAQSKDPAMAFSEPNELTKFQLLQKIPSGDVLVINDTQVLKRRLFADELEILFLDQVRIPIENQNINIQVTENQDCNYWQVLFPSKKFKLFDSVILPGGFEMQLMQKGRPQLVKVTPAIQQKDFDQWAELPLPPYIQKARHERHNVLDEQIWYQTQWAKNPGSMAAPTASLHFSNEDLEELKKRQVKIINLTLHVGLGTFLPVSVEDLNEHQMHSEHYSITSNSWNQILEARHEGHKIWALGTTTTRVLESIARTGQLNGHTDILLQEGSEFKIVDRLMTNFHQPQSTLLALVAGFSNIDHVKKCYQWAIAKKFKLFSYGDLSVWLK